MSVRACGCAGFVRSESAQIANPCSAVGTSSGRHVVRGALQALQPLARVPTDSGGGEGLEGGERSTTRQSEGNREISVPEEEVLDSLVTDRVKDARARAGSGSQMGPNGAGPAPE